jgi:hypothetical protein
MRYNVCVKLKPTRAATTKPDEAIPAQPPNGKLAAARRARMRATMSAVVNASGSDPLHALEPSLTENIGNAIADEIRRGNPLELAAALNGVDPPTLQRWLLRGANGEDQFVPVIREIKFALAESEHALVQQIHDAAKKNWSAAAFLLERMFPERWGKPISRVAIGAMASATGTHEELLAAMSKHSDDEVVRFVADLDEYRQQRLLLAENDKRDEAELTQLCHEG